MAKRGENTRISKKGVTVECGTVMTRKQDKTIWASGPGVDPLGSGGPFSLLSIQKARGQPQSSLAHHYAPITPLSAPLPQVNSRVVV